MENVSAKRLWIVENRSRLVLAWALIALVVVVSLEWGPEVYSVRGAPLVPLVDVCEVPL